MKVRLANHTSNAVEEIFKAYKLCYAKGTQDEIKLPFEDELKALRLKEANNEDWARDIYQLTEGQQVKMAQFIKPLMAAGHTSPLEHVSFTFYITGVSRSLTHQLVRHRTGSYNQQSQRYVELDQFEYVIPPAIENNPQAKDLFIQAMKDDQYTYDGIVHLLETEYLAGGMDKRKAKKKAIEDARYVFPNACTANITMTIDANNFRNLIAQRECVNAQWEIRQLVTEMHRLAEQVVPFIGHKARWCGVICNECNNK